MHEEHCAHKRSTVPTLFMMNRPTHIDAEWMMHQEHGAHCHPPSMNSPTQPMNVNHEWRSRAHTAGVPSIVHAVTRLSDEPTYRLTDKMPHGAGLASGYRSARTGGAGEGSVQLGMFTQVTRAGHGSEQHLVLVLRVALVQGRVSVNDVLGVGFGSLGYNPRGSKDKAQLATKRSPALKNNDRYAPGAV